MIGEDFFRKYAIWILAICAILIIFALVNYYFHLGFNLQTSLQGK